MTAPSENRSEGKFYPAIGAIVGSILGIVAWLVFILLYALYWSKGFNLFQSAVVTIVSMLITSLVIGAMWMLSFRPTGEPRRWWVREDQTKISKRRGNNEVLSAGQRFGEVVSGAIVLLILAFYIYNQLTNTGFFTSKFGGWEMFAFYGSIFLSLVPPIARAVIGRRNRVRPLEAACNIFFAFASLYLLGVFPFNFAHFGDALPGAIRFALSWVTNDIAKVVLVLAFLGGLISAGVNVVRCLTFVPIEEAEETATGGETIPGMSIENEKRSETDFEPRMGSIIGSILGIVAWLVFILLYSLYWSSGFDLFQNVIVTMVSLVVTGLLIGAMWLIWYHPTGELRRKSKKELPAY